MSAADADDRDAERSSVADFGFALSGSDAARSFRSDQLVSRRLRQYLPRDPRSRRPAHAVRRFSDRGQRSAGRRRARSGAASSGKLPVDTLVYLLGSRYCETDRFTQIAWAQFGNVAKGWPLVQAICDYVHDRIKFGYEHASPTKTAWDAHTERRGVCRDFAHLAITLCRCMNIPARYCTGYLGDIGVPPDPAPMDFSAWFEVYPRRSLVHIRRAPQRPAHRPHPHRPRPRRHRCRDRHLVRPVHARRLQGGDGRGAADEGGRRAVIGRAIFAAGLLAGSVMPGMAATSAFLHSSAQIIQQAPCVLGLVELGGERFELCGIDPAIVERDFVGRADELALPVLQDADEFGSFQQRIVGAGVEPGEAAAEPLDRKPSLARVNAD